MVAWVASSRPRSMSRGVGRSGVFPHDVPGVGSRVRTDARVERSGNCGSRHPQAAPHSRRSRAAVLLSGNGGEAVGGERNDLRGPTPPPDGVNGIARGRRMICKKKSPGGGGVVATPAGGGGRGGGE